MKFKVRYYDYDVDKQVTKDCDKMEFKDGEFHFYPVDNPVKIYKAVSISHPKLTIHQNKDKLSISVAGYQRMKGGDYWLTETIVENQESQIITTATKLTEVQDPTP